ncbi:ras guanine nucleotide exchange factor domain-containing protein [Boeremia exigua]|uniref:ras guanine nucleotide exchange factor domain-containing protein n=1 Tax=Boeremia exigua TaxID=749465 RepID=UPI001E8E0093|nr:ras guanine nucleotide exchange factor domain-containing protein [Boeremia exigua]KAH6618460.1 ras guanine nucleotide exchange factor domain-containing protein [Boeremia exigua]
MAPATRRGEKTQSLQAAIPGAPPRPGLKSRAHSAPMVPPERAYEAQDGDEIADDAFFQRYHFPQAVGSTAEEPADSDVDVDSSSDTEGPLSPTHAAHRQPRDGDGPPDQSPESDDAPVLQDLTFAVLGARGAGKSTFIRRALGLPDATAAAACTRKWTIDGAPYLVRFLEMSFNDVQIGDRHHVKWPETIHDMATPRIDGAVTLYDVTSEGSLARVPEMLNILARSHLPFVLAACKCDQHPAHREVDPAVVEQKAKSFLGDVSVFSTAEASPETHRLCLSVIIRAAISARRPRSQASSRRRANSSAVLSMTQKELWAKKHERATSEISSQYSRKGSLGARGHRYKPSHVNKTFFNEESPAYDSDDSADGSDTARSIMTMQPSDENGYTFDQLVDRLLAQPMSKNDTKFVAVFLALYRRFGTPGQLLEGILRRFEQLAKNKDMPMIRVIAQLRYLAVLHQWVAYYPGDFAYPTTRKLMRKFASTISANREFSVAAMEITRDLEMVAEDDDTDWACSDRLRAQSEQLPAFYNTVLDEESEDDAFTRAIGHMSMGSDSLSVARSSTTTRSKSMNGSLGSSLTLVTQVERNERLARQLEPSPLKPLSKAHWHQLMACDDQVIAKELTRMDWIMFSSVRPRDLVRHVSLSTEARKQCRQLENVTRMTAHFNHIAFLVTNYILLRDKPKHRALMLEKWMRIARQVRKLNNYNCLGAVIAGVKGTAVHRLIATRDLVPQAVNHDFLKLDILMGPLKSHWAYRLAWDNSSAERIPYIPLYRRDLVSASEGSATFVGTRPAAPSFTPHPGTSVFGAAAGARDAKEAPPGGVVGKERINWRKFDIMGDVVVGIQRAQGTPYPAWHKCEEVRNLILDVKISKDDDELYERSTHLEATGAGDKGRFAKWLEKR